MKEDSISDFSSKTFSVGLSLFCCAVLFFLVLPIFIILPISFSSSLYLEFPPRSFSLQWYQQYFYSSAWINATLVSLRVAIIVAFAATVIGTLAALGLARSRFVGKGMVNALIISPLIIPHIILAVSARSRRVWMTSMA